MFGKGKVSLPELRLVAMVLRKKIREIPLQNTTTHGAWLKIGTFSPIEKNPLALANIKSEPGETPVPVSCCLNRKGGFHTKKRKLKDPTSHSP